MICQHAMGSLHDQALAALVLCAAQEVMKVQSVARKRPEKVCVRKFGIYLQEAADA